MELVFEQRGNLNHIDGVTDCQLEGESYVITRDASKETISGTIVGVFSQYERNPAFSTNVAASMRLRIGENIQVLPESSDGTPCTDFMFTPQELKQSGELCTIRNANTIAHRSLYSSYESILKRKSGDGNIPPSFEITGDEEYVAAFNSAWTSERIPGRIHRVTEYVEEKNAPETLCPTEDTARRVSWAFEV